MACNDCNTTNNCPEEVTCGCKMELDSLCVRFTNTAGLPTLGILPNARLEDILIAIDNFLNTLNTSIINIEARLDDLEAGHLTVQEEGTNILTDTSIMNFIGEYVTVSLVGTDTVNIDFALLDTALNTEGILQVQDTDVNVGTTTKTLNFEGTEVTSVVDEGSNKTTVTIGTTTTKAIALGTWDMTTETSRAIAHGLSATEWLTIRNIEVMVVRDLGDIMYPLQSNGSNGDDPAYAGFNVSYINSTNVNIDVTSAVNTYFNTNFSGTVINRGYLYLTYTPD